MCSLKNLENIALSSLHKLSQNGLVGGGEGVLHTDKKENQIFLIYKEIQNGAVAKSYMTKGLLIYCIVKYLRISSYIRKPFLIYDFATAPF
jgi:hypothetical protein